MTDIKEATKEILVTSFTEIMPEWGAPSSSRKYYYTSSEGKDYDTGAMTIESFYMDWVCGNSIGEDVSDTADGGIAAKRKFKNPIKIELNQD